VKVDARARPGGSLTFSNVVGGRSPRNPKRDTRLSVLWRPRGSPRGGMREDYRPPESPD